MTTDKVILDDGEFYIDLNCNYEASNAPGFLERRCPYSATTPGGFECIGSFGKALDGTWKADVNAPYDPDTDGRLPHRRQRRLSDGRDCRALARAPHRPRQNLGLKW